MDEQREYPFEFSVVMAVYNVEPFLREAVDSLIQQDFGFERIQLIMVDDGSTDGSGAICDEYAAQYPENVMVIHKENGGVASARNEGLKYIQGRYVNFLDSDDKLDRNVMSVVHTFFRKHEEETDVVAIPMFFFDGANGAHVQNNRKFVKGTKVINLIQDWQAVQLSCSSAFIRSEVAQEMCFDVNLAFCEDGKEIQKILLRKMTIGLVKGTSYRYRRRTQGAPSAIQSSENNIQWYMPYLKGVTEFIILMCIERREYVPKFIQYTLLYDLQWRLKLEQIPDGVLTDEEITAYKSLLLALIQYFDDDVIMAQKDIQIEHKAYLLKKKYGRDADIKWGYNDAILHYGNTYLCHLNTNKTYFDFISINSDSLCLEGYTVLISENYGDVQVFFDVNGEAIPCTMVPREEKMSLGEPIYFCYGFQCKIPLEPDIERYDISLFCMVDGKRISKNKLTFGKFCPISTEYKNSYYYHSGHVLTTAGAKLYLQKCGRKGRVQREYTYLKELWKCNRPGCRKAIVARPLATFLQLFKRKKVWLISDRVNKADDNGEALFQYVTERAPKDVVAYFAISPESQDYSQLKTFGKVIPFGGWLYKILYLMADSVISSQGEEYIFHPFQKQSILYRDMAQSQKFVFLQHGVTHNDLSAWLSRYNKNIALFVTTTRQEYKNILAGKYHYTAKELRLTGFPRYDRLYHEEKKIITIMPTWRAYLVTGIDPKTGLRKIKPGYLESEYFAMYDKLLNSKLLFDAAEHFGYTIAFLDHPNMLCSKEMRRSDPRLLELEIGVAYRKIFAESDLIVTDYSSVAFDFAYLRKPVIYFQEDKKEFYSGAHTFEKGYFDHERDGFGPVVYSSEALVEQIITYMKNGCVVEEKYRKRIDATFPFSDQNNCQRVYEQIMGIENNT